MNKLQQVRYVAAYTALAQKLDKHMKQFDSDPNTQTRWIWELIQNAKDAPNRFGQTKIKQSLDDTYFTSRHNGDAFEIPQLHSIVAQYSTKKEKNSQATKTTGKYGTGFITTYILSKIIEVSAILKVEIQEDSDDQNQNKKSEAKNLKQQNLKGQLQKTKFTNQKNEQSLDALSNSFKKLSTEDDEIQDFQKRTNMHIKEKHQIGKQHKGQSNFYYKKFSIQMDRSYVDRDQELPKKIEKTEKKLTKIVMQAEYESTHNPDFNVRDYQQNQRTVDNLDTQFKYKLTDKRKFEMIQKTLVSTKELLPYAFLFNDNLTYYQFIDKRKFKEQDYSFSIRKGFLANIGKNVFMFTYQIEEGYDHKKQQFSTVKLGYLMSYFNKEKAFAAIPVHIGQNGIKILRVNTQLPKYFKDFPLIGSSDLKWNAIINSRQFYPNQKRSQLILSCIDQANRDKVQTNWIHLQNCFKAIKNLYLFLSFSPNCKSGLQNLLIFSSQNMVANERKQFKIFLDSLIKDICSNKMIPNRINQKGVLTKIEPNVLVFIEIASNQKQIQKNDKKSHLELSLKANQAFSFLYGSQNTISSDHYRSFYEILNHSSQYRKYLESCKLINFVTVNKSLQKMASLNFKQFCVILKGDWQKKLHQIYSLLKEYNESAYLNLSSKGLFFDYKIILNEKQEFKCLRENRLMFNNLPDAYNKLASLIEIDIKTVSIHPDFKKYVKNSDPQFDLDIIKFEILIVHHYKKNKFFLLKENSSQISYLKQLLNLFCLLITFKCIDNQTVALVRRFKHFEKLQAFKINTKELQKFRKNVEEELIKIFVEGFTVYYQCQIKIKTELKKLLEICLMIKFFDEAVDFLKDLMKDKLLGPSLGAVSLKLAWNGIFVQQSTLSKLNEKVQYPDNTDIQIYNIGYNYKKAYPYRSNISDKYLQQRLIHPLYPLTALQKVKTTSYKDLFQPFQQQWFNKLIDQQQKYQVLTYISKINHNYHFATSVDNAMRERYQTWKSDIETRIQKLINFKIQSKQLQQEHIKEFLYRLIDNKQQLSSAQLIYKNNGNALCFTNLLRQLNSVPNGQKVEEPKTKPKM